MGRARHDGYRVDSAPGPTITTTASYTNTIRPESPPSRHVQHARRPRDRMSRNRRPKPSACQNPQVRKGVGACIFVLGIPCLIAGLIFTIVSSADDGAGGRKYPESFPVVGPILLAISVLFFATGILLHNIAIFKAIRDCLNLSNKDSFCRRHFPKLSEWLHPDLTAALNRAALNNLQTAPAKSALRKARNPDLVAVETETTEGQGQGSSSRHGSVSSLHQKRKRGVTFSHSDEEGHVLRLDSSASETERASLHPDSGGAGGTINGQSPSTSLLSLRHCRIHPKSGDEVFWTDSSGAAGGVGAGEGGVGDGGAGHPVSSIQGGSAGGAANVDQALSDIDEENTSDALV